MIYPTETVAGIGSIGSDEKAVKKVFALKRRKWDKPVSYAFSSWEMASRYVDILPKYEHFLDLLPGPLTLILSLKHDHPPLFGTDNLNLAVRIPDVPWLLALIEFIDEPLISTSANISGSLPATSIDTLDQKLVADTDILLTWEGKLQSTPSTILHLGDEVRVIREGAISSEELKRYY